MQPPYNKLNNFYGMKLSLSSCPGAWDHPIYGADQIGTLFKNNGGGSWNVNNLDSIVNLLGPVPGVSSAYLYVGTWRSMFAYHVEDLDLYSINYLHGGASKSWYSIKQKDKKRFESFAVSYFVEEHQQCHEFLRHKTKMFSPTKLKECGIEYTTALHNPGEFIITFPGAYHAGFNHGLNVAESTNFATTRWFDIGRRAKRCICRPYSVAINVSRLETLYLRNERLQGKDLSIFHRDIEDDDSENDGDIISNDIKSRRYRCICATDGIQDVNEDTPLSICCSACTLWGHINCYDHINPDNPLCFMCMAIESDLTNILCDSPIKEESETVDLCRSPVKKKSPKLMKVNSCPLLADDSIQKKKIKRAKRKIEAACWHEVRLNEKTKFR